MIVRSPKIEGIRQLERKLLKNGTILQRVVGCGKVFTWVRNGMLAPELTPDQWLSNLVSEGWTPID